MAYESESVGGLVRGALDDIRDLLREEMALARAELRAEVSKLSAAGMQFGIAAVSLWFAGMFILVALALGIAALFAWPAWTGFAAIGVLLAVAGAVMAINGRRKIRSVQAMPRTVESLKENFR
jgi:hypothetical protein